MTREEMRKRVEGFMQSHGNGQRELTHDEIHELASSMGMSAQQLPLGMRGGLAKIFFGDNNG